MALKPKAVPSSAPVQMILDCHWLVCVRGEGLIDRSIAISFEHDHWHIFTNRPGSPSPGGPGGPILPWNPTSPYRLRKHVLWPQIRVHWVPDLRVSIKSQPLVQEAQSQFRPVFRVVRENLSRPKDAKPCRTIIKFQYWSPDCELNALYPFEKTTKGH